MEKEKIKLKLIFWYSILWVLVFAALYLAYFVYFPDVTSTKSKWVLLFSGAIAVLAFACKYFEISLCNFQNEIFKTSLSLNKCFYKHKNTLIIVFLTLLYLIFHKYLNTLFIISSVCAVVLYMICTKISSRIMIKRQGEAQDSKYILNAMLKLNFNSSCACTFLFWGLLSIGAVILYHIFKDYEIIIGYIYGISTVAFLDNIIYLISKKSFLNTDNILKKYNNSALENAVSIFKGQNCAVFFENYIIVLICAIAMGANTIGLMGAFLPLVASANIMFISVIALLLYKKSRLANVSKFHFKTMTFVIILTNLMLYFEIRYWLNSDYYAIAYSTLAGSVLGAITLYFNGAKSYSSEIKKLKKYSKKALINVSLLIVFLVCIFMLADGFNSDLYSFYCIIMSILGYNLVAAIASTINYSEKYESNQKGYINNGTLLTFVSLVLAFMLIAKVYDADILNPIMLLTLMGGFIISHIFIYFVSGAILKQTKRITLSAKCQKKSTDICTLIKKSVYNASNTAFLLFLCLTFISYAVFKYLNLDYLFVFIVGICLSSIMLLYKNDDILSPIAKILIKYSGIILISTSILFI